MNLKINLMAKPQITLSKCWNGGLIIQVVLQHLHKCRIRVDIFKLLSGICISGEVVKSRKIGLCLRSSHAHFPGLFLLNRKMTLLGSR